MDEVSSVGVGGSRASLIANTSLTSNADLSTLSSITINRRPEDMDQVGGGWEGLRRV